MYIVFFKKFRVCCMRSYYIKSWCYKFLIENVILTLYVIYDMKFFLFCVAICCTAVKIVVMLILKTLCLVTCFR